MKGAGPRILLMGGNYRALCVLERLLDRGERVVAFIGEEGAGERDFCPEILEACDRASIPARSGRKLGEEIVRWLEDRIRPELAISIGLRTEVPLAIGGNCRLGLVDVGDALRGDEPPAVTLRQNGQVLLRRELSGEVKEEGDAGDLYLQLAEATLVLLDDYLDQISDRNTRPVVAIPYDVPLRDEDLQRISGYPDCGPTTTVLEREVATYTGADRVLALGSTSTAFTLLLSALGIEPGQEVLAPGLASRHVVTGLRERGCSVRFVDVDPRSLSVSCERLRDAISPRTRGVVVSHPFGHPADLAAIRALTGRVPILEDASSGLGATLGEGRIGRSPSQCVFQLPIGPLASSCSAALLALPNALAERILPIASRLRLSEGLSRVALRALRNLESDLAIRRRHAAAYSAALQRYDAFQTPPLFPGRSPSWNGYPLRVTPFARTGAEDLSRLLAESGIETRLIAPTAAERELSEVPVAERVCGSTLLLPIHAGMSDSMRSLVLDAVFDYAIG